METGGVIDAILKLLFFVGFVGSLGFYYRLRKRQNIRVITSIIFAVSGVLALALLGSRNEAVAAAALTMLSFGVTICSGGAMLFFNGWRYVNRQKSKE